jgi:hypothetical protein
MPQQIEVPGMGVVEFPDSMNDDQIAAAIQKNMPAPAASSTSAKESPFISAVTGFNTGMERIMHGIAQPLLESGLLGDAIAHGSKKGAAQREAEYKASEAINPTSTHIGEFIGSAAPTMLIPGGVAGSIGRKIATGAAAGFGAGASQYVDDNQSRIMNGLQSGVVGGLMPLPITAATKAFNAVKGRFADKAAQEVLDQGAKYKVPVFADDAAQTSGLKGLGKGLEEIPILGTRGERAAQMQAAQNAASNVTQDLESKMLNLDFGGKTGLKRLEQVANSNSPTRAKAAQNILDQVNNAGDDWQKIIEASGNMKLFRSKLIADQKYNKLAEAADEFGNVTPRNTLSAIDDVILKAQDKTLPDNGLVNQLTQIKDSFASKPYSYSKMRDARSEIGGLISEAYTGKNSLIGSKDAPLLQSIKNAITKDMDDFANSNGSQLKILWKNADSFYQKAVKPYKDVQLAKALSKDAPDEIYSTFVKYGTTEGGKGTSRAQRFYNALDEKGRSAVRYGMVNDAFEKATDTEMKTFSPAKFATSLDKVASSKGVFFKGEQKAELDGFKNLMRHIERSKAAVDKPETGVRVLPWLAGLASGAGAIIAPGATALTAGTAYGLKKLMTTDTGKRLLLASSKLEVGSPAMQRAIDISLRALNRAPVAATQGGE